MTIATLTATEQKPHAGFEKLLPLSTEQLLAMNTAEAAQFALDKLDAESAMHMRGKELSNQGVAWWIDPKAHGMELENFFDASAYPQASATVAATPTPAAPVVAATPAPRRTIAEIEADSAHAAAFAAQIAAKKKEVEAKANWTEIVARHTKEVQAVRHGKVAANVPTVWAQTVARATAQQNQRARR